MRWFARLLVLILVTVALQATAQTLPIGPITQGLVWTPGQWTAAWQSKMDWPPSRAVPLLPWTTATRPSSPAAGWLGYNTTVGSTEFWDGTAWVSSGGASGGTLGALATATSPQRAGDATTGLYSPAAGQVAISTLGVQRLLINGAGLANFLGQVQQNGASLPVLVGTPGAGACLSYTTSGGLPAIQDAGVGLCGSGGGGGTMTGPGSANIGDAAFYGNAGGTLLSDPSLGAASAASVSAAGGATSYAPADTITLAGGTSTTAAVLLVTNTQVVSATVAAGGTGGTPGTQTVTGTTGTGTKFQASVTVSGGGAITAVLSITVAGNYTVNPTAPTVEPVTGASLTGATLNVKLGVLTATVQTAGSYTVAPTNPVAQTSSSGAGTGATFNMTWNQPALGVDAAYNLVAGKAMWLDKASKLSLTSNQVLGGGGANTSFKQNITSTKTDGTFEFGMMQNFIITGGSSVSQKLNLYHTIEVQSGVSAEVWNYNPVIVLDAGATASASQHFELDHVNLSIDTGNDPVVQSGGLANGRYSTAAGLNACLVAGISRCTYNGISIAAGGNHTLNDAIWIANNSVWSAGSLNGAIGSGTTTIAVTSTGPVAFGPAPFLAALRDNSTSIAEIIRVTAIAGSNWTVVRGVNNTVASSHLNGALVSPIGYLRGIEFGGATITASSDVLAPIGFADIDSESQAPYFAWVAGQHTFGIDMSPGLFGSGALMLPNTSGGNNGNIYGRNGANNGWVQMMGVDSGNNVDLGIGAAGVALFAPLVGSSGNFSGGFTVGGALTGNSLSIAGAGTVGGQMSASGGFRASGSASYGLDLSGASLAGSILLKTGAAIYGGSVPVLNYSSNFIILGNNTEAGLSVNTSNILIPNLLHYTGGSNGVVCWNTAGGVVSYNDAAGGSCSLISAARFKHSIQPFRPPTDERGVQRYATARDEVMALRPITYRLNQPSLADAGVDLPGYLADEVALVDPRLAIFQPDGEVLTVRYPLMSAVHTAAIQELIAEQQRLVANQNRLEAELRDLRDLRRATR